MQASPLPLLLYAAARGLLYYIAVIFFRDIRFFFRALLSKSFGSMFHSHQVSLHQTPGQKALLRLLLPFLFLRCMPWSEINSEENQEKIATMRKLIMLRRNEKTCRSPHFHFPDTYENSRAKSTSPASFTFISFSDVFNKTSILFPSSSILIYSTHRSFS